MSKEVLVATAVVDADEPAGLGDLIGVIVHPEDDRVLDEAVLADGIVTRKEQGLASEVAATTFQVPDGTGFACKQSFSDFSYAFVTRGILVTIREQT